MSVAAKPLWQMRLARAAPRWLLYATCLAGLLASARFAIAPPRPVVSPPASASPTRDLAAEAYAALFARRYLTWNAAEPQLGEQLLAPMTGSTMVTDAGLVAPASGQQHVDWVEVVQARVRAAGEHVYTVAAQTDLAGLVYLTVGVMRAADGKLALTGYPAFVGAPASGPAQFAPVGASVTDASLATVVQRTLRNYLSGSASELAADLTRGARVSAPSMSLALESVQRLSWADADRRTVLALVQAHDARGTRYTLAYELDVVDAGGRWEVAAIQTDPDS